MKEIRYANGSVLQYDDTIVVGDLIKTYHAGIHRVVSIETRKKEAPLYHYEIIYDLEGKPSKKVKNCCCASYCLKISEVLPGEIEKHKEAIERLTKILVDLT